jgi:hypothetical protein
MKKILAVMLCSFVGFASIVCLAYGEDMCKKAEKDYDDMFSKYIVAIQNERSILDGKDVGTLSLDDVRKKKAELKMKVKQLTEKLKVLLCTKGNNDKK